MFYFIYGEKGVELALEKKIKEISTANKDIKITFYGVEDEEVILHELSTNSLFAEAKILVLKDANNIKDKNNFIKILNSFSSRGKYLLLTYNETLDEYGKIKNKLKETSKFYKGLQDKFEIIKVESGDKAQEEYLKKELNIDSIEAKRLLEHIGRDDQLFKNEVAKLKNYFNGEKYSFEEIKGIIAKDESGAFSKYVEDFFLGERENLLEELKINNTHLKFLYSLSYENATLYKIKILEENSVISHHDNYNTFKGAKYEGIKHLFKTARGYLHPYALYLKFKLLHSLKKERVLELDAKILEIEFKIKSGQGDEKVLIESFVAGF